MMVEKQAAFLWHLAIFLQWCKNNGHIVTGGELYRTQEQQALYFEGGKSKKRHSRHQDRLAIDLNYFIDGRLAMPEEYRVLGKKWESLGPGLRWGGRYGVREEEYSTKVGWDANHFEMT